MTPALLIALLQQIAIPELMAWLKSRHDAGQVIDDDAIIEKLHMDAAEVMGIALQWLKEHPPTD